MLIGLTRGEIRDCWQQDLPSDMGSGDRVTIMLLFGLDLLRPCGKKKNMRPRRQRSPLTCNERRDRLAIHVNRFRANTCQTRRITQRTMF